MYVLASVSAWSAYDSYASVIAVSRASTYVVLAFVPIAVFAEAISVSRAVMSFAFTPIAAKLLAIFELAVTIAAALVAIELVTVVLKFASLPIASANSLSVSNAPGAPLITPATALST